MRSVTVTIFLSLTGALVILLLGLMGTLDEVEGRLVPINPWYKQQHPAHHQFRRPRGRGMREQSYSPSFANQQGSPRVHGWNILTGRYSTTVCVNSMAHDEMPRDCTESGCQWCCSDQFCHPDREVADCWWRCPFAINFCTDYAFTSVTPGITDGVRYEKDKLIGNVNRFCTSRVRMGNFTGAISWQDSELYRQHVLYKTFDIKIPIHYDGVYSITIGLMEPDKSDIPADNPPIRDMTATLNGMHIIYENLTNGTLKYNQVMLITKMFRVTGNAKMMRGWEEPRPTQTTIDNNIIVLHLQTNLKENPSNNNKYYNYGIIHTLLVKIEG